MRAFLLDSIEHHFKVVDSMGLARAVRRLIGDVDLHPVVGVCVRTSPGLTGR